MAQASAAAAADATAGQAASLSPAALVAANPLPSPRAVCVGVLASQIVVDTYDGDEDDCPVWTKLPSEALTSQATLNAVRVTTTTGTVMHPLTCAVGTAVTHSIGLPWLLQQKHQKLLPTRQAPMGCSNYALTLSPLLALARFLTPPSVACLQPSTHSKDPLTSSTSWCSWRYSTVSPIASPRQRHYSPHPRPPRFTGGSRQRPGG